MDRQLKNFLSRAGKVEKSLEVLFGSGIRLLDATPGRSLRENPTIITGFFAGQEVQDRTDHFLTIYPVSPKGVKMIGFSYDPEQRWQRFKGYRFERSNLISDGQRVVLGLTHKGESFLYRCYVDPKYALAVGHSVPKERLMEFALDKETGHVFPIRNRKVIF